MYHQGFPWIESGSLVRNFWSAMEYGGIPDFLSRLKVRRRARTNGEMCKKKSYCNKIKTNNISAHHQVGCNGSGKFATAIVASVTGNMLS